jgi:hypothetical protein
VKLIFQSYSNYLNALIAFCWLCILFSSCNQNYSKGQTDNNKTDQDTILSIDTSRITVLTNDKIDFFSLKDSMHVKLTNADIQLIETLLANCIQAYDKDKDSTNLYGGYIVAENYKRQYVPYANKKGEKKVFINCFCRGFTGFTKWKTALLVVDDGGLCFFNTTINLTKKSFGSILIYGPPV